jgi:hypothetical protein
MMAVSRLGMAVPSALHAWVLSGAEMLDNGGVHGVSHGVYSSPERSGWEQHSIGCSTGEAVSLG